MRHLRLVPRLFLVSILFPFAVAFGQSYQQTWGPVTSAGPVGTARNYRQFGAVPSTYTIDWFNDGTAASVCTFQVEGSSDGVHWHPLTGSMTCATYDPAASMIHITSKAVMFLRVNIPTYTAAADGTDKVTFNYTRGS